MYLNIQQRWLTQMRGDALSVGCVSGCDILTPS